MLSFFYKQFSNSERRFQLIRWGLVLSWLLLITSLFYDPFSTAWTAPDSGSFWADPLINAAQKSETCVRVQGICLPESPYAIGNRAFWGMVIPSAILIVLLFGHEVWRRICPLYFLSQIPRALGLKPLLDIHKNLWLQRNHFYLQFVLFFLGLNLRILWVNSSRMALGLFLILTIAGAIATIVLYGGRSWCHYVCPFGMVQTVFTGPRGLLGSKAHTAPVGTITQSMCRTVSLGKEQSACVNCKATCLDIDAEKSYWHHLQKPGRQLVQYGYLGLVVGYVTYYWLYAGNTEYYFSGAWSHEPNSLSSLLKPGFYLAGQALNIPKIIAAPLTLAGFSGLGYSFGAYLELFFRRFYRLRKIEISREQIRHQSFSICTFLAFNFFFLYGGRPEINRLSLNAQLAFQAVIACISVLWLSRTWECSPERYNRESIADKLRRQLRKLPFDIEHFWDNSSEIGSANLTLESLTPEQVQILAQTLPLATQRDHLSLYYSVLEEILSTGLASPSVAFKLLIPLRNSLKINEDQHHRLLNDWIETEARCSDDFRASRVLMSETQASEKDIQKTVIRQTQSSPLKTSRHQYESTRIRHKS